MHRLVAEDAGNGFREIAVAENRNHAKVTARGALLEAGREAQHVRLGLQRLDRDMTTSSRIKHAAQERRIACCQRFVQTFSGQVRAAGKKSILAFVERYAARGV